MIWVGYVHVLFGLVISGSAAWLAFFLLKKLAQLLIVVWVSFPLPLRYKLLLVLGCVVTYMHIFLNEEAEYHED